MLAMIVAPPQTYAPGQRGMVMQTMGRMRGWMSCRPWAGRVGRADQGIVGGACGAGQFGLAGPCTTLAALHGTGVPGNAVATSASGMGLQLAGLWSQYLSVC